jgi:hypothetical protein
MTVRVIGQLTGVDTAEQLRLGLSLFMHPSGAGVLDRRSGLVPYVGSADLTGVSPMVGRISPCIAWIDGTSGNLQGGYPVVVDANTDITFGNGEAGNTRIDRVVLQIRDNPYDASGTQAGRVFIVQGQAGGAANAVPASSTLLWEVTVPANASVGGGGFTMSTARADKRGWTTALGGLLIVKDASDEASVTPHEGMEIYRLDGKAKRLYTNGAWQWNQRLYAEKTVDQTYSSTTVTDDGELKFTGLPQGATYIYKGFVRYGAHESADLALIHSGPTNYTMSWGVLGKEASQATGSISTPNWAELAQGSTAIIGGATTNNTLKMVGIIEGRFYTGDGGTLQLRASQANSNGTGSIIYQQSYLEARRVG